MSGYFALLAGRVEEARSRLEAAVTLPPPAPKLARPLLAQIDLVQNRKEAAQAEASQALAQAPDSPTALFSMGLVKMAAFDLPAATRYLQKAIEADPRFVDAYVYLAKIWLGSEYLSRAQKTIDQALQIAPRDPAVLSLAGFIRLAFRDYSQAFACWNRALKADPRFGEPHLGLAIYHFRYREFHRGLGGDAHRHPSRPPGRLLPDRAGQGPLSRRAPLTGPWRFTTTPRPWTPRTRLLIFTKASPSPTSTGRVKRSRRSTSPSN